MGSSAWFSRACSIGRLMVDTFLNARELVRETKYDLGHLTQQLLKKPYSEFSEEYLPKAYTTSTNLLRLCSHTEEDAFRTFELMIHLSIIPLTKQLTKIAGNLWHRSLQNARAERNEMLLMHKFYAEGYLCPDKPVHKKHVEGEEEEIKGKRKKAAYAGGYVLEPKAGFYDNFILMLDFNSLYPSIIQEY